MKRTVLVLVLLAGIMVIPATAQDFSSPRPQFFSFSYNIPIGFNMGIEELVTGHTHNFTLSFAVMDNVDIGFDRVALRRGYEFVATANLIRIDFNFLRRFGAAFAFGFEDDGSSVLSLGISGNFFQARAASGFAYAMGLRFDYLMRLYHPDNIDQGTFFLGIRLTMGI